MKDNLTASEPSTPGCCVCAWFHDETIFYAHDWHHKTWYHKDASATPYAKGEGASFLVTRYVSANYGFLMALMEGTLNGYLSQGKIMMAILQMKISFNKSQMQWICSWSFTLMMTMTLSTTMPPSTLSAQITHHQPEKCQNSPHLLAKTGLSRSQNVMKIERALKKQMDLVMRQRR